MSTRAAVAALTILALSAARSTLADPLGCERGIARAAARHVQGFAKILYRCEDGKAGLKYRETTICATDPLFESQRVALSTKLVVAVNQACGGPNGACGDADDEPLAGTAWNGIGACPDVGNAGCTNPITTCADVAQCLACIDQAAATHAMTLTYGAFDREEFGTASPVNRCQRAIGKAAYKYLVTRSKVMQRCWDARAVGQHANPCPDPGDGRAALQLARAEERKVAAMCKACGGADRQCDGTGDLAPSVIGFVATCPAVTTPFPPVACGGPVAATAALAACIDCVIDFDGDCSGAAAVPGAAGPPPASCNPAPATTTTTSTSLPGTTTSSTSTSTTTSLPATTTTTTSTSTTTSTPDTTSSSVPDTSSTTTTTTSTSTTSTTGTGPSGFDFLSAVGGGVCGQTFRFTDGTTPLKNLLCGNLSLGGGLSQVPDNTTPAGATNRFALSCVGSACTVGPTTAGSTPAGVDCTNTGCAFGTPLPIANSGLSVCVTNTFSAPVAGTLNTGTGVATLNFQLNSRTILTTNPVTPCPTCRDSVDGTVLAGSLAVPQTGVCDGSPNQGSTCTTRNAQGVTADCPSPAAVPGTSRCYRGTNNNLPCAVGTDCPGGACALYIGDIAISLNPLTTGVSTLSSATGLFCPDQTQTEVGAFRSAICRTGAANLLGKPCVANFDCGAGGTCRSGTLNNYCVGGANDGLGCSVASDCPLGQCVRAGTQVKLIRSQGAAAGALTIGVAKSIRLGSAFCVGATTNPTVNSNANLPGPGATALVGNVTLLP
jgi:hypothetical protein